MEENLMNELENLASIKYLDNVTNCASSNNCCAADDQVCTSVTIEIKE